MDGIVSVAKQQVQMTSDETQGKVSQELLQSVPKIDVIKDMQEDSAVKSNKINSEKQMDELVSDLNKAMAPMSTNLKFAVDMDEIFYVKVIESETNKMIRRFPAEKAADFLPKMQEVTGMLFDLKG